MSEQKMREALERLRAVVVQRNCGGMEWGDQFDDLMTALGMADEALAQQPAAVVELTDDEIIVEYLIEMQQKLSDHGKANVIRVCRKVISAHTAKQNA